VAAYKAYDKVDIMSYPFVSIIIPCRKIDDQTRECVIRCAELDYPAFEIMVLPDRADAPSLEDAVVIQTGDVSPGRKRNIGAKTAKGDVLAFIDSDAYPRRDWLSNAIRYLQMAGVGAVGGPAITPAEDGPLAKAEGIMLSSFLVGGGLSFRYSGRGISFDVDDIHSVNFLAWRSVIEAAGGWNETFWPGEDTLICLGIKKAGYRQLFAGDVLVYHHRRPTWKGYLRQLYNYGLHRGHFARRFPETSRRPNYFLPMAMLLWIPIGIIISLTVNDAIWVYAITLLIYSSLVGAVVIKNPAYALLIAVGIPLTHMTYGAGFLHGLLARRLKR
jgi:cellulose synthase/poly-beta-1,6-N-acetylglucosamine synthase-like glycosyltransferase